MKQHTAALACLFAVVLAVVSASEYTSFPTYPTSSSSSTGPGYQCDDPEPVDDLVMCRDFSDSTCCTRAYTEQLLAEFEEDREYYETQCTGATELCLAYLEAEKCRSCSPDHRVDFETCKAFCQKKQEACKDLDCSGSETTGSKPGATYTSYYSIYGSGAVRMPNEQQGGHGLVGGGGMRKAVAAARPRGGETSYYYYPSGDPTGTGASGGETSGSSSTSSTGECADSPTTDCFTVAVSTGRSGNGAASVNPCAVVAALVSGLVAAYVLE